MYNSLQPQTAACQASLSFTVSQNLLKLKSIESMKLSNQLKLCFPLLFLPPIFPSIRIFPSEIPLFIRWLKYWSFRFSISASNEYSGLISSRTDWFDLLSVQGMLKSLLKHHSSNTLILWNPPAMWKTWSIPGLGRSPRERNGYPLQYSGLENGLYSPWDWKSWTRMNCFHFTAFFMVQLSHLYMTTGKTTALTIETFVSKVMSLLYNFLLQTSNKQKRIENCMLHKIFVKYSQRNISFIQ